MRLSLINQLFVTMSRPIYITFESTQKNMTILFLVWLLCVFLTRLLVDAISLKAYAVENIDGRNHSSRVTSPLPSSSSLSSSLSSFLLYPPSTVSESRSRRETSFKSHHHPGWKRIQRGAPLPTSNFAKEQQETFLDVIDDISRGLKCRLKDPPFVFLPPSAQSIQELPASLWRLKNFVTSNRVSLLASVLAQYSPTSDNFKMLRNALDQLVRLDHEFFRARIVWLKNEKLSNDELIAEYFVHLERKRRLSTESYNKSISLQEPYFRLPTQGRKNQYLHQLLRDRIVHISTSSFSRDELNFAEWTPVYFSCEMRKWLMSYTAFIVSDSENLPGSNAYSLKGLISIDIDITDTDFNQCDTMIEDLDGPVSLVGTHKCDRDSSMCMFHHGFGWRRGGYTCICKDGFFSTSTTSSNLNDQQKDVKHVFNGSLVESAWKLKNQRRGVAYEMIYSCKKCPDGCENCTDGLSCSTSSEWILKSSLTVVALVCIGLVILLIYYTCWY